jgi:hypothetical protein
MDLEHGEDYPDVRCARKDHLCEELNSFMDVIMGNRWMVVVEFLLPARNGLVFSKDPTHRLNNAKAAL